MREVEAKAILYCNNVLCPVPELLAVASLAGFVIKCLMMCLIITWGIVDWLGLFIQVDMFTYFFDTFVQVRVMITICSITKWEIYANEVHRFAYQQE